MDSVQIFYAVSVLDLLWDFQLFEIFLVTSEAENNKIGLSYEESICILHFGSFGYVQ